MTCRLPGFLPIPVGGCEGGGWLVDAVLACVLAAVLAAGVQAFRSWRGGRGAWPWAIPMAAAIVGGLLVLAAEGPWLVRGAGIAEGRHLAVVIDGSASARRNAQQLPAALQRAGDRLAEASRGSRPADTASVVMAADGVAEIRRSLPLSGLAGALPGLAGETGPPDGESNLADGIRAGIRSVRAAGGVGSILLLSDGLETRGDALVAAKEAGRSGIPVHVLPVASPSPGVGLVASHLPPRVAAGARTQLRMVIANPSAAAAQFRLRASLNGAAFDAAAPAAETVAAVPPASTASATLPLEFSGRGLQFVDVELTPLHPGRADGGPPQGRRLYTQVDAPARVAVVGPAPWLAGLPPDRYRVERVVEGAAFDTGDLDIVVIDGVPAQRLAEGQAGRLAAAVREHGQGLLLVNGPHPGGSEDPTVLAGYEATALDPLLPLSSKPREEAVEPPGRQIAIMIDTSGSMCGARLQLAQDVAVRIVEQLRSRDVLTITAFASGYNDLLTNSLMGAEGKARARTALGSLACGGGTDPNAALQRLGAKGSRQCGLFFISDGEFDLQARQPGCLTTVFAVDQTAATVNADIRQMGEVHFVNGPRDAAGLKLGFFHPEMRKKTFEPGRYRPDPLIPDAGYLPDPPQELEGDAVSFPRDRIELAATRPYPPDPVLAFLDGGAGTTAAFTTAVPAAWAGGPGARAVEAWMERLAAWPHRDRYLFDMVDENGTPILLISLTVRDGRTPVVQQLSASLRGAKGDIPLRAEADPGQWGRFRVRLPDDPGMDGAVLVLREIGPDALDREQRIPVRLAPVGRRAAAAASEQRSFGLNADLLKGIARVSGGTYDPAPAVFAKTASPPPLATPLWPALLALAALLYVTMIVVGRLRR